MPIAVHAELLAVTERLVARSRASRAHVRRVGQGAGGDPRRPRGAGRRRAGARARWRPHPCRRRCRHGDEGEFAARELAAAPDDDFAQFSLGRGLFGLFRRHARIAEEGGSALDLSEAEAATGQGASTPASAAQTVAQ